MGVTVVVGAGSAGRVSLIRSKVLQTVARRAAAFRAWVAGAVPLSCRVRLAAWLHGLSIEVQPAVAEDPFYWQARMVEAAVAASSRDEAQRAAWDTVKHLDEKTIAFIVMLMARDFAWSQTDQGRSYVRSFVEARQFHQFVDGFDDV